MLLTDSYGKERDVTPVLLTDEEIEKYVELGMQICPDFDIEVDDSQNTISYSRTVKYPKTDFHDERQATLSIVAYFNPCDGEICKAEYLEAGEDGKKQSLLDSKGWLRDSLINEELAPEVGTLMDTLIKECDLKNKDKSAYDKTILAMFKTLPFKYEDVWNCYTELKKMSTRCRYDRTDGKVIADGREYFVRGNYIILGDRVFESVREAKEKAEEERTGTPNRDTISRS